MVQHPPRNFKATCAGRVIRVIRHEVVTVRLTWLTWLFKPKRDKKKRPIPRKVQFQVIEVQGMHWRKPLWWLWPGKFTLHAPAGAGDRWRKSGVEKPHRFKFARNSATEARLLRIAWVIQLAYAQASGGVLLATLPPQKPVPPTLWERLRTELKVRGVMRRAARPT